MEQWLEQYPISTFLIGLGLTVVIGFIAYFFARLLLTNVSHATSIRPPLITAMSLLGILGTIALIGALFTTQESAYTIAATVVGGLTGYLTAQAQQNRISAEKEIGEEQLPEPILAEVPEYEEPDELEVDPGVTDDDDWDNEEDTEDEQR